MDSELNGLFSDYWENKLRESPELASRVGDTRYNACWQSRGHEDYARRARFAEAMLARLDRVEVKASTFQERLSCDLLRRELDLSVERHRLGVHFLPTLAPFGFHMLPAFMPQALAFRGLKDYQDFIARMEAFPAFVEENLALMREAIDMGRTLPSAQYPQVLASLAPHLDPVPRDSAFFAPYRSLPTHFSERQREVLQNDALRVIFEAIIPGYRRIQAFVETEVKQSLRDTIGLSDIPGGAACYAHFIRDQADSTLPPKTIHEMGLAEVERLEAAMDAIASRGGADGLKRYAALLRGDASMFAKSGAEYVERARAVCKEIDPTLPKLFGKLPRTPYGVALMPEDLARGYATPGAAEAPSGDGRKAGMLRVNGNRVGDLPYYMIQATMLHECAPGHLMHFALTNEIENLPQFRRYGMNGGYTAYVEGWALYCEGLGEDLGLPHTPEMDFGRLDFERLRAARLVVDTGIHALGWSRDQAIDYLDDHCTLGRPLAVSEVDRYIGMPAQALSYKLGQMKIRELRARAEQALGVSFELREFHDRILELGGVTLDVMENAINAWIEASRATCGTAHRAAEA